MTRDEILEKVRALPSPYRPGAHRDPEGVWWKCDWCHFRQSVWSKDRHTEPPHPANDCLWYLAHQPLAAEPVSPAPVGAAETWPRVINDDGTFRLEQTQPPNSYLVLMRDGVEVVSMPCAVTEPKDEIIRLLTGAWLKARRAASSEADPGRRGLPGRVSRGIAPASPDASAEMPPTSAAPRSASLDAAETPAPEPTPLANQPFTGRRRDIQTLHDVVALLARTIWDKQVPAGKHLWSIPVDKERDFDCILSDAIDELEWLRAQSAPVVAAPAPTRDLHAAFREVFSQAELDELADAAVAAPAPTPQELRGAIARLYWTIPPECADARRELRAFEELLLPRTRIETGAAPAETPTWQPIETAPRVEPLNGGDDLLLAWIVPGIGEWIRVVGQWRDGWWTGSRKAFPTHWMPVPAPPLSAPTKETP